MSSSTRIGDLLQQREEGVSVVIPCRDEEASVGKTVEAICHALAENDRSSPAPLPWEIIVVNDGSRDGSGDILADLAQRIPQLQVIENGTSCGYGASLKRGVARSRFDRIAISDADSTYPVERIPELVSRLETKDMVIGARTGKKVSIPLLRRPAKWALLHYARLLSGSDIKDLNSGLRAVWVESILRWWFMLPDGFSFTSTLTLASHASGLRVEYVPIDYLRRSGRSSIRPVRDTLRFFSLVFRTAMYFKPFQMFGSLALLLFLLAAAVGVGGKLWTDSVPDVITVSLLSTGLVFLGLGLIGDLINARRSL